MAGEHYFLCNAVENSPRWNAVFIPSPLGCLKIVVDANPLWQKARAEKLFQKRSFSDTAHSFKNQDCRRAGITQTPFDLREHIHAAHKEACICGAEGRSGNVWTRFVARDNRVLARILNL